MIPRLAISIDVRKIYKSDYVKFRFCVTCKSKKDILSYLHEMPVICHCSQLELLNVLSCRTFIALSHVKAHPLPFRKSFESGHVDGRVVNKYVPCVILLNKAIPLVFTVPLYSSFCHSADLLKKFCFKPQAATLAKETILKGPSD